MRFIGRYQTQIILAALALAGIEFASDVIHITHVFAVVR